MEEDIHVLTLDIDNDGAYLNLKDGELADFTDTSLDRTYGIILDFNKQRELIGIEFTDLEIINYLVKD